MKHRSSKTKGEQRIRALLEQTASARGEAFFPALVSGLAQALGTRYSCLAVLRGEEELECLALWDGTKVRRGARYRCPHSPCGEAVGDGVLRRPRGRAGGLPRGRDAARARHRGLRRRRAARARTAACSAC